jgi:hypothetical protein
MRAFGDKLTTGLVCLAALLMPLSGVPHLVCRCPDGQIKPFCLGTILAKNSGRCCCGGACSSGSGGGRCCCCRPRGTRCADGGPGATCCGGHQASPGPGPEGAGVATVPCCLKTLPAPAPPAVVPAKGVAGKDGRHGADVSLPPGSVHAAVRATLHALGLVHSPGPPADLPTLLRRLLI